MKIRMGEIVHIVLAGTRIRQERNICIPNCANSRVPGLAGAKNKTGTYNIDSEFMVLTIFYVLHKS